MVRMDLTLCPSLIVALSTFLALLAAPTLEQDYWVPRPPSPCPKVFMYDPPGPEPGWWSGVISVSSDYLLHSLWLDIMLDTEVLELQHRTAMVTTQNFKSFRIEIEDLQIYPGFPISFPFLVKYNSTGSTPRVQWIGLNGRVICNVTGQSTVGLTVSTVVTPESNSNNMKPVINLSTPIYYAVPTPATSINPSTGSQDNVYNTLTTQRPDRRPEPPVSEPEGPNYTDSPGGQSQCGKVIANPVPLVVDGTPAVEGQWPWHIAVYQTRNVDNKYICGGTLVSLKHVITAAHSVTRRQSQRPVDRNTVTIYLGKHNLRTSADGVQIRFVKEIIIHPDYNVTVFRHAVAILELHQSVTYSDWVRPVCLWPDSEVDINNIIGKKGSVVGWGFDATGEPTEELGLVEMPVVTQETCLRSYSEFFVKFTSDYTYCAGNRNGPSVCNGDSGGGMVFRMNGTWYLRGLVSLSVARRNEFRCDPSHYVIFTDLAKYLTWIHGIVSL